MIKLQFWPWGYASWSILRESNENWGWAVNKKPAIAQQTLAHASVALVWALFVNLSQFYVCTRKCKYIQVLEQKFTQFFKVRLLSIHVLYKYIWPLKSELKLAETIQFSNELLINYHQSTMLFSSIVVVKWRKWGNLHNRKL